MAPLLEYKQASSLKSDGSRNYVHPADVRGRFDRVRKVSFAVLIALLVLLPWIEVGGHPAVFLDVAQRRFYLFGSTFNAQDVWKMFFLLSGAGFALLVVTAVWGRVWCGYACPQTVFLEGLFRPIERLLEGPRTVRMRRNAGPWTADKILRKGAKHAIYLLLSFALAHVVISYFVSIPQLYAMVTSAPGEHPEAFVWAASITAGLYFVFSWFREQLCLIVCPYGRLQSVMTDTQTVVIGYDEQRGEPRGKANDPTRGDCVDCNRCVVVCPTGIDIRNGLQLDCIGCARCVDACDEVMVRLKRPKGLVRYDSLAGLRGEPRRLWRSRLYVYAALGFVGLLVAGFSLRGSTPYEANLLRLTGQPHTLRGDQVQNGFQVHIVNKDAARHRFRVRGVAPPEARFVVALPEVEIGSLQSRMVPVFVTFSRGTVPDGTRAELVVEVDGQPPRRLQAPLSAPR